jgi:hypothetical protein
MIKDITLDKESKYYLQVRWLRKQYEKVKKFILSWYLELADFKIRQPKQDWVYSFRINWQYRALWRFLWVNIFEVFEIYDHKR